MRQTKEANIKLLIQELANLSWDNVLLEEDTNMAYDKFMVEFMRSFIKCCPLTEIGKKRNEIPKKPWLSIKKGMLLYSAVSSPLDRSKRFTLSSPGRPVHSDTVLGFSWKHSSHAAIAQRLFTHISTTIYSQVLMYTAESTEAS